MELSELQLNDFVYITNLYSENECVKNVTQIEDIEDFYLYEHYTPIPLSIDFFLNNGFRMETYFDNIAEENITEYIRYEDWGRMIYNSEWKWFYVIITKNTVNDFNANLCMKVEYIHEVQHLIRDGKLYDIANNLKFE